MMEGERMKANIEFSIRVKCDGCGKVGEDHDIPTMTFPDGSYRALCEECRVSLKMQRRKRD